MAFKGLVGSLAKKFSSLTGRDENKNEAQPNKPASQSKPWSRRSLRRRSIRKKSAKNSENPTNNKFREQNVQGWQSQMEAASSSLTRGTSFRSSGDSAYGSIGRKEGRRKKAKHEKNIKDQQQQDDERKSQDVHDNEQNTESEASDVSDANEHEPTEDEMKPDIIVDSPDGAIERTTVADMVRNYERRQGISQDRKPTVELANGIQRPPYPEIHLKHEAEIEELTKDEIQELSEICTELKKVLNDLKVPYFSIYQDPFDSHQICVQGANVTDLCSNLKSAIRRDRSKFFIWTKNMSHKPKEPPSVKDWVNTKSTPSCTLAEKEGNNNNHERSVTELFLTGYDRRRTRPRLEYYGATTAHSFISQAQMEDHNFFRQSFLKDWLEIVQSSWVKKHHLLCQFQRPIDILPPPFPLYSYWHPRWVATKDAWLLDFAMFKLDERQLSENGWLSPDDRGNDAQMHQDTTAQIVRIQDADDLESFQKRRILCSGQIGKIMKAPDNVSSDSQFGLHLAFTLNNPNQMLQPGSCGSLVYLLGSSNGDLPIIGMFFGTSTLNPAIHQAVVVSKALEQMQNIPEYYVESLQLMPK